MSCMCLAEFLSARLEREKTSDAFGELPFHYLEIASLLFKKCVRFASFGTLSSRSLSWVCSAPDDVEHVEHIRSLLEDLQNVRQDKIRNGLFKISSDVQSGGTAYAIQV